MCAEEGSPRPDEGEFDEKIIKSFMRGFGKTMILWMISKEKIHGYEIMRRLERFYSFKGMHCKNMKPPGPSVIYPVLHDLERKGLIEGEWEMHGEKRVKYYHITPLGEKTIDRIRHIMRDHVSKIWEDFWNDMFPPEKEDER
ncbi:PadR family transcriptional regulator [Methanothermobacter thermautotrophicus]|uniref:PadR family transcriptional regulator n=1 Tax=Methanothermobacter thermautotrophicus TaxID=145262 RepID=A0A842YQJ5_METTF|nr:PadR family transcriptional regulator [Methanothermobacter thermautotrophicus]MBE2899945.1 PadR family transcriptional regulator [Methanothermobacter thermautotrophicus]MCQ8905741.1 PadR family transcriptional regulator [Methanothermobacter sp.]